VRPVRGLAVDVADEDRPVAVPQHLADRLVLAGVVPVVVGRAQQQVAVADALARLLEQLRRGHVVQPGIGLARDRLPRRERFVERRCLRRRAVGVQLVDIGQQQAALGGPQPVALLLPGHVAHVPAQAVHGPEPAARLLVRGSGHAAHELAARKAELIDQRVRHRASY
jgi:hypothetical protein